MHASSANDPGSGDLGPREADLVARSLILRPKNVPRYFADGRFLELAALADYLRRDVPHILAHTDPALYRSLRDGVTKLHLMGFGTLNAGALRRAARRGFRFRSPSAHLDPRIARGPSRM